MGWEACSQQKCAGKEAWLWSSDLHPLTPLRPIFKLIPLEARFPQGLVSEAQV